MSAEDKDWIQKLVEEDRAIKEAAASRARLSDKIREEAPNLIKKILEAVRRDVERINTELYGRKLIKVGEVSDRVFLIERNIAPAARMSVSIDPDEHALEYDLIIQQDRDSLPSEEQPGKITIGPGQDINDLRFIKGNNLLSVDSISRLLIEPVVRAGGLGQERQ